MLNYGAMIMVNATLAALNKIDNCGEEEFRKSKFGFTAIMHFADKNQFSLGGRFEK